MEQPAEEPAEQPAEEPKEQEQEEPAVASACPMAPPAIIRIDTAGGAPILNKDDYVAATVAIDPVDDLPLFEATTSIRGRGNSTWELAKKPFRLKLGEKSSVLGMPKDKDWALLANYADKSMLRNAVAFCLGSMLEMPYVPRSHFAELTLNAQYQGLYQVTEHIKTGSNRVDIGAEDETLDSGFLIELDVRLDGDYPFESPWGLPYIVKSDATEEQADAIATHIAEFEMALAGPSFTDPDVGYAKYIDVGSVVDFYIVNELMRNNDAMYSSSYIYRPRGGKLIFGPLWDFDVAAGNINNGNDNPVGFWVANTAYMSRLLEDPAFVAKVHARWQELRPRMPALLAYIDEAASTLDAAQMRNFNVWDILSTSTWPYGPVNYSYAGEIGYLKSWLTQRAEWLDTQWLASQ